MCVVFGVACVLALRSHVGFGVSFVLALRSHVGFGVTTFGDVHLCYHDDNFMLDYTI